MTIKIKINKPTILSTRKFQSQRCIESKVERQVGAKSGKMIFIEIRNFFFYALGSHRDFPIGNNAIRALLEEKERDKIVVLSINTS